MEANPKPVKKRGHGGVIVLAIVLLGLVFAGAYYQQELLTYWRLQGWDTAAVRRTMERFVSEAHAGNPSAGELLDPAWCQPSIEGGKFVGVRHTSALGPTVTRVRTIIPEPSIQACNVRIKNKSGVFQADVQYPNGQWAPFDVDRVRGALRIRTVPDALSSSQPQRQPWD
jgi:hypothetical protein